MGSTTESFVTFNIPDCVVECRKSARRDLRKYKYVSLHVKNRSLKIFMFKGPKVETAKIHLENEDEFKPKTITTWFKKTYHIIKLKDSHASYTLRFIDEDHCKQYSDELNKRRLAITPAHAVTPPASAPGSLNSNNVTDIPIDEVSPEQQSEGQSNENGISVEIEKALKETSSAINNEITTAFDTLAIRLINILKPGLPK